MPVPTRHALSLPALLLLAVASPARAQDVQGSLDVLTIYRCVGMDEAVALRDSPCLPGESQQVRTQLRPHPRDPVRPQHPPRPVVVTPVASTEVPVASVAGAPGLVRDVATRPLARRPNRR